MLNFLAYNVRWCWSHDTIELFRRLDRDLWETSGHNPVRLLGSIEQRKLESAAKDDAFLAHMRRVLANLQPYMDHDGTWFHKIWAKKPDAPLIAYFSAEFGLRKRHQAVWPLRAYVFARMCNQVRCKRRMQRSNFILGASTLAGRSRTAVRSQCIRNRTMAVITFTGARPRRPKVDYMDSPFACAPAILIFRQGLFRD
jgi:uncharacterized protein DUF3417